MDVTEMLKLTISNALIALCQPFWCALIMSVTFMLVWKNYSSFKQAIKQWIEWFKTEPLFRRMFFLVFYTVMILFRTLLNRSNVG